MTVYDGNYGEMLPARIPERRNDDVRRTPFVLGWGFVVLWMIIVIAVISAIYIVHEERVNSLEEDLQEADRLVIEKEEELREEISKSEGLQWNLENLQGRVTNLEEQVANLSEDMQIFKIVEREILLRTVYCEAGGEAEIVQLAVAATILNRVKANSSEFGGDILLKVLFHPYAFTPVNDGKVFTVKIPQQSREALEQVINRAVAGEDPTKAFLGEGALYFYSEEGLSKKAQVAREEIQLKTQLGGLIFYNQWDT